MEEDSFTHMRLLEKLEGINFNVTEHEPVLTSE